MTSDSTPATAMTAADATEFLPDAGAAASFLAALQRRFACKRFRTDIRLSASCTEFLLECGRLSPSSFGLEHWHFEVIEGRKSILALGKACLGQEAVCTAPCAIVILTRRGAELDPDSDFVRQRGLRFPGSIEDFIDDYRPYWQGLVRDGRLEHWSRAQGYIAGANMMTGAAATGLDSCPIEGFEEDEVLACIGRKKSEWSVSLVISFGKADEETRPKIREPLDRISDRSGDAQ
jgi:nitroreductase